MANEWGESFESVATGFELQEATDTAAPQVVVTCRVITGPQSGAEKRYYGSLHENAQQYTAEALRTMGWKCNDITALSGLGDTKFILREKFEQYKGKRTTKHSVFPLRSAKATVGETSKAAFSAQFKALAASVAAVTVDDNNKAPTELPPAIARSSNGAPPTTGGVQSQEF